MRNISTQPTMPNSTDNWIKQNQLHVIRFVSREFICFSSPRRTQCCLQETPGNATCLRRICGHGLGQGLLAKSSGRCPVLPVELPLEGKWEETKKGEKRNHLIPPAQDSHLEHRRPKKEWIFANLPWKLYTELILFSVSTTPDI